jgi:endonuclease/exonuclease/phosphatase family metal-dependent hydrolase
VVKTIKQADADVVCLQETNEASAAYLRKHLKALYPNICFRGAPAAGGFGFLSKVPIRNLRYIPRKYGWFGAYVCSVKLEGRSVQIANVHLLPTLPKRGMSVAAFIRLLAASEAVRLREIAHVCKNLSKKLPTIIAGDLNSLPNWQAPRYLAKAGYSDSVVETREDHLKVVTWKWTWDGQDVALRLDYVFSDGDLEAVRSDIIPGGGSDHYLQVTTLQWPADEDAEASPAEQ